MTTFIIIGLGVIIVMLRLADDSSAVELRRRNAELEAVNADLSQQLIAEWYTNMELRTEVGENRTNLFIMRLRLDAAQRALNLQPLSDADFELLMRDAHETTNKEDE